MIMGIRSFTRDNARATNLFAVRANGAIARSHNRNIDAT